MLNVVGDFERHGHRDVHVHVKCLRYVHTWRLRLLLRQCHRQSLTLRQWKCKHKCTEWVWTHSWCFTLKLTQTQTETSSVNIPLEYEGTTKGPFTLCVFCIICVKHKEWVLYRFFAFDATSHRCNVAIWRRRKRKRTGKCWRSCEWTLKVRQQVNGVTVKQRCLVPGSWVVRRWGCRRPTPELPLFPLPVCTWCSSPSCFAATSEGGASSRTWNQNKIK